MRVLGLTGGIAMGKSTAAAVFARGGVPVFSADAAVHRLQRPGGAAVAPIGRAFPNAIRGGTVDRVALRQIVLGDPEALRRLEGILHPLVRKEARMFLARCRRANTPMVVMDIPLLFETGGDRDVDCVVVVTAPAQVQMQRLRRRGQLSEDQIAAVLARQMPDVQKRRRADVLIHTGLSRHHGLRQIRRLIVRCNP